jgi:hypothetical protein
MADMFPKLLHALCVLPFHNTPDLTVALRVMGSVVRLFVS